VARQGLARVFPFSAESIVTGCVGSNLYRLLKNVRSPFDRLRANGGDFEFINQSVHAELVEARELVFQQPVYY
jgi:hypothetical protein